MFTALDVTMTTNHSVTLNGLSPNTNYIFKVKSKPAGASVQTVSANQEFDTLANQSLLSHQQIFFRFLCLPYSTRVVFIGQLSK